jgi:hypothetical protein
MANLATIEDVEDRLGRSLTESEAARVEALLQDASALVVSYTGQEFLEGTSNSLLQVKQGKIRLPQKPATDVISAVDLDDRNLSFKWDEFQTLYVTAPNFSMVRVEYDHGTVLPPEDVVAVVAGITLRTLQVSPDAAQGVTQQTAGPFSVTYATWAVGGQAVLSPTDKAILDRYRVSVAGTIDTLG